MYTAAGAMWGDTITLPDGKVVKWQEMYDSVYALSSSDPGEHEGRRPNFREMTLAKPDQAEIVAAYWCRLIPKGSSKYSGEQPVRFNPIKASEEVDIPSLVTPETKVDTDLIQETEGIEEITLDEAIAMLPEGSRILERYGSPDALTMTGVVYSEREYYGREMRKGETVVYNLPPSIQKLSLDTLSILHRKDRRYAGSIQYNVIDASGRMRDVSDTEGAYTRVMVFDGNSQEWVVWHDPYKRTDDIHYGAKFAEKRPPGGPEVETLYDWAKQGDIRPLYVAVTAIGDGPRAVTNYHGLELQMFPEVGDEAKQEYIFSRGTRFVDRERGIFEPSYGGGGARGNDYPGSISLGVYGSIRSEGTETDEYYLRDDGSLVVNINGSYEFSRLEVAAGDTHSDGKLGWAKLYAHLEWTDEYGSTHKQQLFKNQNVPPHGVIKGSPTEKIQVKPGDKIIVRSGGDTSHIMGLRIQ
jgi:hypothetical protein